MPIHEIEYAVRTRDERDDTLNYDIRPTLAMAQDSRDLVREAYADGGTYGADAEVVMRAEGTTDWTVLTDDDIERLQQEAREGLDRAFTPVIAAGLEQLREQLRMPRNEAVLPLPR